MTNVTTPQTKTWTISAADIVYHNGAFFLDVNPNQWTEGERIIWEKDNKWFEGTLPALKLWDTVKLINVREFPNELSLDATRCSEAYKSLATQTEYLIKVVQGHIKNHQEKFTPTSGKASWDKTNDLAEVNKRLKELIDFTQSF